MDLYMWGLDNVACLLILPLFSWVPCEEHCSIRTRSLLLLDRGTPAQSAGGEKIHNEFFSVMAELWTRLSYGDVERWSWNLPRVGGKVHVEGVVGVGGVGVSEASINQGQKMKRD